MMHNQQQQFLDPSFMQQHQVGNVNGVLPPMPMEYQNALLAQQLMQQQQQQQQQNVEPPGPANSNSTNNDPAAAAMAQMMNGSNVQMAPHQQLAMAQMMQAMMAQQQMAAMFQMQQQQGGGDQQQFNPMAAALSIGMLPPMPPAMFDNNANGMSPEMAYHLMMQQQLQQQHGMMGMYGGMSGMPFPQHHLGGQEFMNQQHQAMLANQMNINNNSNSNTPNGIGTVKPVSRGPKVQYDDVDIMYRKRGRPLGSKNTTTKDSFKNVPKGKRTKRVAKGNTTTNGNGVVARGGGIQKVAKGGKKATEKKKNGKNASNSKDSIPNGDDLQEYYDVLTSLKNSITC